MKQSEALRVRLTPEEARAFKNFADEKKEFRSVLLRKAVREMVNEPCPDLLQDEQTTVRVVIRQLAGICRNLNQVTTAINSGIARDIHVDILYLNQIKQHVDTVKDEFLNYLEITRKRKIIKKDTHKHHA